MEQTLKDITKILETKINGFCFKWQFEKLKNNNIFDPSGLKHWHVEFQCKPREEIILENKQYLMLPKAFKLVIEECFVENENGLITNKRNKKGIIKYSFYISSMCNFKNKNVTRWSVKEYFLIKKTFFEIEDFEKNIINFLNDFKYKYYE